MWRRRRWRTGSRRCSPGLGVPEADARQTAAVLVRTNLRGIDTHGVMRVLPYLEKLRSGEVNATAHPRAEVREGVLHVDGDRGLGQVVASFAVERAVELARSQPVVMGIIRNSGHLAALGLFVLPAAEQGMIAVLCQETPPLMALEGASGAAIGNNPIAFAAPVAAGRRWCSTWRPASWRAATCSRPHATRRRSRKAGRSARTASRPPIRWSRSRAPCFPVAGHKGIGLAMMVQILAGSLSASRTAESAATFGATSAAGNVSAFLLVINPDRVVGRAAFDAHVAQWLTTYTAASGEEARYPGERASLCEVERAARRHTAVARSGGGIAKGRRAGRPRASISRPRHVLKPPTDMRYTPGRRHPRTLRLDLIE